jgi:2-polyprenyl-3-methyl-5-hydroxy-6-metoxy-1,4-benzoquinol methylase
LKGIADDVRRAVQNARPDESLIIPTPSLRWDGLLDRCWQVTANGGGNTGRPRTAIRKALTTAKLLTGDYSQSWQPCARAAAEVVNRHSRVDVCIGEHGPDAGLFLARWYSKRFDVPWLADFRDSVLGAFNVFARGIYKPIIKRLLSTATCTVNVTDYWAELDRKLFGLPAVSVPNGFDATEFSAPLDESRNGQFTIGYSGGIKRGHELNVFFEGLALLKQRLGGHTSERLRLTYRGGSADRVAELAARYGLSDLVDSGVAVDRGEALSLNRRADLLLLLPLVDRSRRDVYWSKGHYPGKVFEYFGARRPIICVPGDEGVLDELIRRTGTGVTLRSPQEVAGHLEQALGAWRAGLPIPYEPRDEIVTQYTRRNLTERLSSLLDRVKEQSVCSEAAVNSTSTDIGCPPVRHGLFDDTAQNFARGIDEAIAKHRYKRGDLFLKALKKFVPEEGRVLDYGCGPGRIAWLAAREGYDVHAIDQSAGMIGEAVRQNLEGCRLTFEVSQGNGEQLKDDAYDGVICSSVIEYVPDPAALLQNFNRSLRPGGALIISYANGQSLWRKYAELRFKKVYPHFELIHNVWSFRQMKGALNEAGFKVVDGPTFFESPSDHRRYLTAFGPSSLVGTLGLIVGRIEGKRGS